METFVRCSEAISTCLQDKRFTIANMHSEQRALDMHIHDCYEIYYSLSDGNQFFIDDKSYSISRGDLFLINNYETHHVYERDCTPHERIVISIHPDMLARISSQNSDMSHCFTHRDKSFCNKISLSKQEQSRFIFLVHKISSANGFASDLVENCAFTEIMIMINSLCHPVAIEESKKPTYEYNGTVVEIMAHINGNIAGELTIASISNKFFLSDAHICRLFKAETGTTIHKYITARRISSAKAILADGKNVSQACEGSGFNDYSNFVKAFTQVVGLSPKKYGKLSAS